MTSPSPKKPNPLLGYIALIAVIAIATVRCLVTFVPELWLEADAFTNPTRHISFGPAAAALLDTLAPIALLLTIIDSIKNHRRPYLFLIILWTLGSAFALYHGRADAESMRIGLNWSAALAIALAALHLGADAIKRRILIAALIALLAPLSLHAAYQVAVEHPATVAAYDANPEEALTQRGITPGSEAQRKFEQRLYQREASGRVGLSNVFGSLIMCLTILAIGTAASFITARTQNPATKYTLIAMAILGLIALALTFSKGAVLAMVAATGAIAAAWFVFKKFRSNARVFGALAIAIVLFGFIAILLRGAAGPPETAAGERSLLFRYHYWQGAAHMLAAQPITGVGPAQFGERYLTHKNPISPEDINDPHNIAVSFIATLGLGGVAWTALLLTLIYLAAKPLTQTQSHTITSDSTNAPTNPWRLAITIGLIASLGSLVIPFGLYGPVAIAFTLIALLPTLLGAKVLRDGQPAMGAVLIIAGPIAAIALLPEVGFWLAGLVAMIALIGALAHSAALDSPFARLALFAAAVAALLHSQIEMNLTHTMTAPAIALLIGVAAAPLTSNSPSQSATRFIPIALVALTLGAIFSLGALPILNQQSHLARAAESVAQNNYTAALNTHLPAAAHILPDPRIDQRRSQLYLDLAALTSSQNDAQRTTVALHEALKALETARQHNLRLGQLWRAQANLARRAALITADPTWNTRAFDAATHMLPFMPHDTSAHILAADLARAASQNDQAGVWYTRALALDEQMWLDPTKQLPQDERQQILNQIAPLATLKKDSP